MPAEQAFFSNVKNVTITGGTFNMNNGPVINNNNSQHITRNGPTYNNYGQQTINQAPPYNDYGYNPHTFHKPEDPAQRHPTPGQTRSPQSYTQSSNQYPNNYSPRDSQGFPDTRNQAHRAPSLMGANDFQTNAIDPSRFRSPTREPPREPLPQLRNPRERIVHSFGQSGSYATAENPVIHGMSPEFQRRFESLMEMVPKAEESDGSDDDDLYTADQAFNTRRTIPHTSRHVRSRSDPHSGSSMDVEMRDSSQDPTLDNSSVPPEGSPSNFESPAALVTANPPPLTTHYHIDNRVITTNINSGNVNTENTYDSFNDNSTSTEVHKQIAKKNVIGDKGFRAPAAKGNIIS